MKILLVGLSNAIRFNLIIMSLMCARIIFKLCFNIYFEHECISVAFRESNDAGDCFVP